MTHSNAVVKSLCVVCLVMIGVSSSLPVSRLSPLAAQLQYLEKALQGAQDGKKLQLMMPIANLQQKLYGITFPHLLETLRNASALQPRNVAVGSRLAKCLIENAHFTEALKLLESLVHIHPKNVYVYELLGNAYSGLQQYNHATSSFGRCTELTSRKNPRLLSVLMQSYANENKFTVALEVCKKLKSLVPKSAAFYERSYCRIYSRMNRFQIYLSTDCRDAVNSYQVPSYRDVTLDMLLCGSHHAEIDSQEKANPSQVVEKWKECRPKMEESCAQLGGSVQCALVTNNKTRFMQHTVWSCWPENECNSRDLQVFYAKERLCQTSRCSVKKCGNFEDIVTNLPDTSLSLQDVLAKNPLKDEL